MSESPNNPERSLNVVRLPGLTEYGDAWALQRALHEDIATSARPDTLLLLEHPHTLTMGRRGGWGNLRSTPEALEAQGVQRWQIDRGGDITYHGPGQLVGYPIVNLQRADLHIGDFMRLLEQVQIDLLAAHGIDADRLDAFPGVWCKQNKITAVGVRVTRWTTMHGFALNINTSLRAFEHILPCGLEGKGVTSMTQQLGVEQLDLEEIASEVAQIFARLSSRVLHWRSPESLPALDADALERVRLECLVTSPH